MIGLNVVTLFKVVNKLMLQGSEKSCFLYTVLHPWYTGCFGAFWSWLSLCFCCFLFQPCLSSLLWRIFERETWVYSVAVEGGSPAYDISMSCRMQFVCLTQYCTDTTKKTWALIQVTECSRLIHCRSYKMYCWSSELLWKSSKQRSKLD
jgi:hypothetical protein